MIQKIKLKFTHSVNQGPIIVNKKLKNKIDVYSGDWTSDLWLVKPAFQQASNILVCHYLIFLLYFFANFQK